MNDADPSMTESTKAKRRRFRFTLRSLLIAISVAVLWMGWYSSRTQKQKRALATIHRLQGDVSFAHEFPNGKWLWQNMGRDRKAMIPGPVWLRSLIGDDYFRMPVSLTLNMRDSRSLMQLSPQDLVHVGMLTKLEYLNLRGADVSGGMHYLRALQTLRVLDLEGASITHDDLGEIARLKNLEWLNLSETAITGESLEALQGLTKLEDIYLSIDPTSAKVREGLQRARDFMPNVAVKVDTYWRNSTADTSQEGP